ncbi:MAG: hypothetical protein O8C56_09445, partial [Candidatus Methanoperedens sp.]|nr:hypothetical protein [Candidatus Methanoperedens sp.]
EEILGMVTRWDEKEKTERALELLSILEKIKAGNYEITVIIDDPLGNSAIIAKNARSRELTDEETTHIKTGMIIFEK